MTQLNGSVATHGARRSSLMARHSSFVARRSSLIADFCLLESLADHSFASGKLSVDPAAIFLRDPGVTFVPRLRPSLTFIFFLTSHFNDSIHSDSCNKRPLHASMKNGRENRQPWQPKRKQQQRKRNTSSAAEKTKGDAKASPKFLYDVVQFTASRTAAISGMRFSVFGQSAR